MQDQGYHNFPKSGCFGYSPSQVVLIFPKSDAMNGGTLFHINISTPAIATKPRGDPY